MKKILLLIIISLILISCTKSNNHSPKSAFTESVSIDNLPLSNDLMYTEEFRRDNHQYIRFHYRYSGGEVSDAVVHDPECTYCDMYNS